MVEGQRPNLGGDCGNRGTDRAGVTLGSWIPPGPVLLKWKEDASQGAALSQVLQCPALSLQYQTVVFKLSVSDLLGCKGLNCSSYAN